MNVKCVLVLAEIVVFIYIKLCLSGIMRDYIYEVYQEWRFGMLESDLKKKPKLFTPPVTPLLIKDLMLMSLEAELYICECRCCWGNNTPSRGKLSLSVSRTFVEKWRGTCYSLSLFAEHTFSQHNNYLIYCWSIYLCNLVRSRALFVTNRTNLKQCTVFCSGLIQEWCNYVAQQANRFLCLFNSI